MNEELMKWMCDLLEITCPFQLTRDPRPFPKFVINRKVDVIDDFKFEDFEVADYNPHPKITMEMAVWLIGLFATRGVFKKFSGWSG